MGTGGDGDSGTYSERADERDESRIGRRECLKLVGVAAASATTMTAGSGVARAASSGYGESGYGEGPYGGGGGFIVSTGEATGVDATSATLDGNLSDLDGASSADCYFEWRRTGASSWTATSKQTLSSTGSFSANLSGLEDGTEYEYRAAGTASDGDTDTGSTTTFTTTSDSPAVTTGAPSNVTGSSATLNGSLDDLGGADSADCAFEWRSVGASSWNTTPTQTLTTTGSFDADVSGLSSGTEYEYRAVVTASDGDADAGGTTSFTTTDSAPSVATDAPSNVTASDASLNGSLDDLGGASSADCYFEWRRTGASSWTATTKQTFSSTGSFSANLSGLEDGAEYEYRAVGEASDGDTDTGSTTTFTTTDDSPTVTTGTPANVTGSNATLNGSLDDLGGADSADCCLEWRSVGASSWNTTATETLSSTGSFTAEVSGLSSGTDYEYRAVVTASDGDTGTGGTTSFTTDSGSSAPSVDSYSVTEAGSPNPHAEITADWSVSDADADLDTVAVSVSDSSGTTVDSTRTGASGGSASGTETFKLKHVDGQTFDVTVTVTDAAGNSDSRTRSVTE